ncbi:precorrin-4 C(11)-methyltransferase, partial [Candidatus Entotheonella palauensis]
MTSSASATSRTAIIAVTHHGLDQAKRLRQKLGAGRLYRPAHHGPPQLRWESPYEGPLSAQIEALFGHYDHLVFFLATGAVTRLIAPYITDKTTDPGVVTVDEASRFVIALLSGHQGGANALARTVAGHLGATPVITTASDVIGSLSPDLLTETLGWVPEPGGHLKAAAAALVNGEPVAIVQEIGTTGSWLNQWGLPDHVQVAYRAAQLSLSDSSPAQEFRQAWWITDRVDDALHRSVAEQTLWFRPQSLVLGVGCERGIPLAALEDGLDLFLHEHGLAKASITALASLDLKADEAAIVDLAQQHGWQTFFYSAEELAHVPGVKRPSEVVEACVGTPGVSEPAALKAAATDQLLVEKQVITSARSDKRMTFAIARLGTFEDRSQAAGKLTFIGAGPGDPDLLTVKARRVIEQADLVIYAGSLIPEAILQHAPPTATLHNSAPMTLEDVMTLMMEAIRAGQSVVRLQSGDLSLYSAMQEQMTQLDDANITYDIIPGVSAFQAAAAALRSELTIPEETQTIILTRGEGQTPMPEGESLTALAAHRASLCIFLSARLSRKVQDQLLTAYAPETPVGILYRVSWPDELIVVTELQHLHRTIREHKLTRTTLILVGEAIGARQNRSRLYHTTHAHIFR